MSETQIEGDQILDGTIGRNDLNTTTTSQAVIRKIIALNGVAILTSTGVDAGTGDVSIQSDLTYLDTKYFSKTQSVAQNTVLAGPTSGSGVPTFRALTIGDIPVPTLQQVTSAGNNTSNNIAVTGGLNGSSLLIDATTSTYKILAATSGGWARGLSAFSNDGASLYGSYGFYGSTGTMNYGYMGTAYNDAILKWNSVGIGIGLTSSNGPANHRLHVILPAGINTNSIIRAEHNDGFISLQNASSSTVMVPMLMGKASYQAAYGLMLRGTGSAGYTSAAVHISGTNANDNGLVTSGNILSVNNYTTNLLTVDYLGLVKIVGLAGTGTRLVSADSSGNLSTTSESDPIYTAAVPNILMFKANIGGTADLNTYTTTGVYVQQANAQAATGTNYPAPLAGKLEVVTSGGFTWQTYHIYNAGNSNNGFWKRALYSSVWSAWVKDLDNAAAFIQNQNTAAQTANSWINGISRAAFFVDDLTGYTIRSQSGFTGFFTTTALSVAASVKMGSLVISNTYTTAAPTNGLYVLGQSNLTGTVNTANGIQMAKASSAASGAISYYSTTYKAWTTYMAQAGTTTNGVNGNITAPTGNLVTSWALRNFIEAASGYGFTWEVGTSGANPSAIIMELNSNTGQLRLSNLAGSGNRIIMADANGILSSLPALTVPNGGTGATTLTGVVFGSGTSAMTALSSSTANQLLRRNAANTGYEWWSADYVSSNLYTADGTITADRTVNLGTKTLYLTNGSFNVAVGNEIYLQSTGDNISILANGVVFGNSTYQAFLNTGLLGSNINLNLPSSSGTLALTTDIINLYNNNGVLSSNRYVSMNAKTLNFSDFTYDTTNHFYGFRIGEGDNSGDKGGMSFYEPSIDKYSSIAAASDISGNVYGGIEIVSGSVNSNYGFSTSQPFIQIYADADFGSYMSGAIRAFNFDTSNYSTLYFGNADNKSWWLPNEGGTIAVQPWVTAQGYVTGNLATSDLSQTADRNYAGNSHSLAFNNMYGLSIEVINEFYVYSGANTNFECDGNVYFAVSNNFLVSASAQFKVDAPTLSLNSSGGGPIDIYGSAGVKIRNAGFGVVFSTSSITTADKTLAAQNKNGTIALDEDFSSGTYNPTITGGETYDASVFTYSRVKNIVHVSGRVEVSVTGAGDHDFLVSLPINSNITSDEDLIGVVSGDIKPSGFVAHQQNLIYGNTTTDEARVSFSTDEDAIVYIQFDYITH